MGYPMAKNLVLGLDQEKTVLVCDVDAEAVSRFKAEVEGRRLVETVSNGFEAAKAAVRFSRAPIDIHQ